MNFLYKLNKTCLIIFFLFTICSASQKKILLKEWQFVYMGSDSTNVLDNDSLKWEDLKIPHTFNPYEKFNEHKTGIGWYRREIKIPDHLKDSDLILSFQGVCLRARVYLDGKEIAGSSIAWLPFNVELTEMVRPGDKYELAVRVDSRPGRNDIPDVHCNGWWMYGGMIREAWLEQKPEKRLENIQLRTLYKRKNCFTVRLSTDYRGMKPDRIRVAIFEVGRRRKFLEKELDYADKDSVCLFEVKGVKEWNTENPFLYRFEITPEYKGKSGETSEINRGFAQLYTKERYIYLNGRRIFLRGIGRHDVKIGPIFSREQRTKDLGDIKDLGANCLRIAHYPQHHDIYELCDSLGILVIDEIPAWKTSSRYLSSEEGRKKGRMYMDRMIKYHGNYTSLSVWSVGNEFQSLNSLVAGFIEDMAGYIHMKDPGRPVTFSSYFYQYDRSYDYVDIISLNEYFGWYLGSLSMLTPMLSKVQKKWMDKPIVISEFGAAADLGHRNNDPKLSNIISSFFKKDMSEDHQKLYLTSHMKEMWKYNQLCKGMVVWCYNDFMEPRTKPSTDDMPAGLNAMGLVTRKREKKLAWNAVKDMFTKIKNEYYEKVLKRFEKKK